MNAKRKAPKLVLFFFIFGFQLFLPCQVNNPMTRENSRQIESAFHNPLVAPYFHIWIWYSDSYSIPSPISTAIFFAVYAIL